MTITHNSCGCHSTFMSVALEEAKIAFEKDEVPIGAVIVKDGNIIARGHNLRETLKDATCHAEIVAIRNACKELGGWRLPGCTLYVTIEPCPMCAGAAVNARIERIVFGAPDVKGGGCGSVLNVASNPLLNHRIEIISGVLEGDCKLLMKSFFKLKR